MTTQLLLHIPVTNPVEFLAQSWPVDPSKSLLFWCHGRAGGVLLYSGLHYMAAPGEAGRIVFALPGLAVGDVVSIVTFP